jgi:hypothetical protein
MVLTVSKGVRVLGVAPNDTWPTAQGSRIIAGACAGMAHLVLDIAYYTTAPASAPTIEFSSNGLNWPSIQSAGSDPAIAVGVAAMYYADLQIKAWKFYRITLPQPSGTFTAQGSAKLLAVIQE